MTPEQFLTAARKKELAPAYLFLGSEAYQKERCRQALFEAVFGASPEAREQGIARHDLQEISLAAALDDARALSLFASERVLWLFNLESVLPRGKAANEDGAEETPQGDPLAEYLREPTPGTVVILDASRYGFDGEDKAKIERVQKHFSGIPAVEFRPFSPEAARSLAQTLAKQAGLQLGLPELALLLEATGGEAARLACEIEKLSLFAGARKVSAADIAALVADAQSSTIFALVGAMGRGERARSFELLDTLTKQGEYMPLALSFLATQFRMALAARDARMTSASQIQAHFNKLGARIWPDRARQIEETVSAFSKAQLELALGKLYEADHQLRDTRPDDRVIMENLVVALTSKA